MNPEDLAWLSAYDDYCMRNIFLPIIKELCAHEGKHRISRAQCVEQINDIPRAILYMQLGRLQTQH